jgi:type VI secretion system secreted protein Hcp
MATAQFFLKVDGVDGGSVADKHKGEIDVESFAWDESLTSASSAGGGSGAGKVSMHDFRVVTRISKASPKLMVACATGQRFKSVILSCEKAAGTHQLFFRITMSDASISAYQSGGTASSDTVPTEQTSFKFSKIEFEYIEQKPDGSPGVPVKAGFDLITNKAF